MDLAELGAVWGLELTASERADHRHLLDGAREALDDLRATASPTFETLHGSPTRFERTDLREADAATNAWVHRCRIEGAPAGPLDGLRVGIKDNVAVAGVPCTAGASALADFVPEIDATAVGRLLEAGATVTGKHNMDAFAMGDTGGLSDFGSVRNPVDPDFLAGGSSSGSAAAIAAGECDAAIGTDQAGSVRTPAAWCGVVGMKPTYGAIPYTGAFGMDLGFDHLGVLSRSVRDNARVFRAVAGTDRQYGCRLDPRQPSTVEPPPLRAMLRDPAGLRIGILQEGFDSGVTSAVAESVRASLGDLAARGVDLEPVSVPVHETVPALVGVATAIGTATTYRHGGVGGPAPGWHWPRGRAAFHEALQESSSLPPTVVHALVVAADCWKRDGYTAYAEAKATALSLGQAYDAALDRCDALAMPTAPRTALPVDDTVDRVTRVERLGRIPRNTGGANQTGHPAVSVPCGSVDGLPVGLQLLGSRGDEATLYRLATAVEAETAA
jgi:amidase